MKNIVINKMIAGLLVGTNILVSGGLTGNIEKNPRLVAQTKILDTIDDGQLKEHYQTKEEAEARLAELKEQTTVVSSDIKNGTFKFTDKVIKESVAKDKTIQDLAKQLKNEIEAKGYKFVKATHSKKMVKELVDTKKYQTNTKTFEAKTEKEVQEKIQEYANAVNEKYINKSTKENIYGVEFNSTIKPKYDKGVTKYGYTHVYNTEAEATKYVVDKVNEGYDVNYAINPQITDTNTEYDYVYERDTGHGLLFDNDQALVYAIGHPDPRPDLVALGYAVVDVNFEPVYTRWDTVTYDVVYTYAKPIVKNNTKYELVATMAKKGNIVGYIGQLDYNVTNNIYDTVEREVVDVNGKMEKVLDGYEIDAELLFDEFLNYIDPHVLDKALPNFDMEEFLNKLGEFPDDPDLNDEILDEIQDELFPSFPSVTPKLPTIPKPNVPTPKVPTTKPNVPKPEVKPTKPNLPNNTNVVHTGDDFDLATALLAFMTGVSALGISLKKKEKEKTK